MKGKLSEGSGSVYCEGVDFREIERWNGDLSDGAGLLMNLHYPNWTPAALQNHPF